MGSRRRFVWLLLAAVLVLGLVAPQALAKAPPGCQAAAAADRSGSCSFMMSGSFVEVIVTGVIAEGGFQIFVDGSSCGFGSASARVSVNDFVCFKFVGPGSHVVRMVVGGVVALLRASGPTCEVIVCL